MLIRHFRTDTAQSVEQLGIVQAASALFGGAPAGLDRIGHPDFFPFLQYFQRFWSDLDQRILIARHLQVFISDQYPDHFADFPIIIGAHEAVRLQLIQPEIGDALLFAARQDADDFLDAVTSAHPHNAGQDFLGFFGDVYLLRAV